MLSAQVGSEKVTMFVIFKADQSTSNSHRRSLQVFTQKIGKSLYLFFEFLSSNFSL